MPQAPIGRETADSEKGKRCYAAHPQPEGYDVSYRSAPGKMRAIPLWMPSENRYIPPGESAIVALALMDGKVYGTTVGNRSHLFRYDPSDQSLRRIGTLEGESFAHGSLVAASDGSLYAGTMKDRKDGYLFRLIEDGDLQGIAVPVEGDGIGCLVGGPRALLYGLSDPGGWLFEFRLDTGKARKIARIDDRGLYSRAMLLAGDGKLYGAGRWGKLFAYDPATDEFNFTKLEVPVLAGRRMYTGVGAWASDPRRALLFGGESADGLLFKLDLSMMRVVCLGKPVSQNGISCLTVASDGRVYGVGGGPGGVAHLFSYDPESGDIRDLGVPYADDKTPWHGYEFSSAVAGPNGEIYLGECDRISCLFIYSGL